VEDDLARTDKGTPLVERDQFSSAEQRDDRHTVQGVDERVDQTHGDALPTLTRIDHDIVDIGVEAAITDRSGEANKRRIVPRSDRETGPQHEGVVLLTALWPPSDSAMKFVK
jgi:hypothetical protein